MTGQTFEQFAKERLFFIEKKIEDISNECALLKSERRSIKRTLGISTYRPHKNRSKPTISATALQALKSKGPSKSAVIVADVNAALGTKYPRESIAPYLSKLKDKGLVTLSNGIWTAIT